MATAKFLETHRTWEDYLGMALGVLIILSPIVNGYGDNPAVLYNAGAIGVLVAALAALEIVDLRRWEEGLEMLAGFWLMASPFVLGYADGGALMVVHLLLGAGVALLAMFELWQDWKLSSQDLARHGH